MLLPTLEQPVIRRRYGLMTWWESVGKHSWVCAIAQVWRLTTATVGSSFRTVTLWDSSRFWIGEDPTLSS